MALLEPSRTALVGTQKLRLFGLEVIIAATILAGAVLISHRWAISAVASGAGSGVYDPGSLDGHHESVLAA